ncbi:hypothetical protein DEO72_LG3g1105 [Vigna unguiculata]|uniref:Uncharacterized protein n=1 Tax=Vigna unguiculata TaxID=3917 RepID=A0A4D6LDA2_VIGUN|nr:hypothetical protein DEO72_LG3g1105 [Vigna unguiculata]
MSFSNSSGSCTCGGKQPSGGSDGGGSSHDGGSSHGCGARIFGIKPMCYYGQTIVLRATKTLKNKEMEEEVCVKKNLIDQDVVKMEERDSRGIKVLKLEKIEEKDVVNMRERDGGWITTEKLDKL